MDLRSFSFFEFAFLFYSCKKLDKFSVHLENVWDKKVFPSRYGKPQAKTLGFLVKKKSRSVLKSWLILMKKYIKSTSFYLYEKVIWHLKYDVYTWILHLTQVYVQ